MRILLYANGSAQNHGCEAIKNTTLSLFGNNEYKVSSTNVAYDHPMEHVEYIPYSFQKKYSLLERLFRHFHLKKFVRGKLQLDQFIPYFINCDLSMSVGGDNYCYGEAEWLYYLHDLAVEAKKPSILWGASIEDSLLDEKMEEDFRKYDMLVVRESISYHSLMRRKIPNVFHCPDPAFCLEARKPVALDAGFDPNQKYIGINISPLVEQREKREGLMQINVENTIRDILENTSYSILLIPHVITDDSNDYELLRKYKERFPSERVILIGDHSCEELKYYISHCDVMIAARTHASIAAYSQCIPTLVIGYSVKSRGIARDLFGKEEGYVLSINDIVQEDSLRKGFRFIFDHRTQIQEHLESLMPGYIAELYEVVDRIKKVYF